MIFDEMRISLVVLIVALLVNCCYGRSVQKRHGRDVNNGELLASEHQLDDFSDGQDGLPNIDLPLQAESHPLNNGSHQQLVDLSNERQQIQLPVINDLHEEQSRNLHTRDEQHESDGRDEHENNRLIANLEENIGDGATDENVETGQGDLEYGEHNHEEQQVDLHGLEHGEHVMGPEQEQTTIRRLSLSSTDEMGHVTMSNSNSVTQDQVTVKPAPSSDRSPGRRELPENERVSREEVHLLLDASLNNGHVTEEPIKRHRGNNITQNPSEQHEPFLLEPGLDVENLGNVISLQNGEHELVNGIGSENPGNQISNGEVANDTSSTEQQPQNHNRDEEGSVVHGVTLSYNGIIPYERRPGENIEPETVLGNSNNSSTAPTVNLHHEHSGMIEHDNHGEGSEQHGVDVPLEIPKTNNSIEHENVEHSHLNEINRLTIQGATATSPSTGSLTTSQRIYIIPSPVTNRRQFTGPPINTDELTSNRTGEFEPGNGDSETEEFHRNNITRSNNEGDASNIEHRNASLNRDHTESENEFSISENSCNDSVITDEASGMDGTEIDPDENVGALKDIIDKTRPINCKSNSQEQHFSSQIVSEINLQNSIEHSTTEIVLQPTAPSDVTMSSLVQRFQRTQENVANGREQTKTYIYIPEFSSITSPYINRMTDTITGVQEMSKADGMTTTDVDSVSTSQPNYSTGSFQLQTNALLTEIVDGSTDIFLLDPSMTQFPQLTSPFSEFEQFLENSNTEIIFSSESVSLESTAKGTPITPSRSTDYALYSTKDDIGDQTDHGETSRRLGGTSVSTLVPSHELPRFTEIAPASREESLPDLTDLGSTLQTETMRSSTSFVSSTTILQSTNNRTSLRVLFVGPSTKMKLPDRTTASQRITSKKHGIQKPTEKPNINPETPEPSSTPAIFTLRHPVTLPPPYSPTIDTSLVKTTKDLVMTTPPQVFLQIYIRMSTCQFIYQKPNFISELKDLIVTEKQVRIEYEQFVVQLKNVHEEYCKDVPGEIAVGEETVDQITVDMYIVDKKGKIDIRLTYDVSSVISKGFTDSSSAFKDKIVGVDIQRNAENKFVPKLSDAQIIKTDEEKASITMVIVLGSVGGCCCVILVILQVVLIHRRVTSKRKASYLNRQLSGRSMDNVALGVIPKSRPNSGYWNPALADVEDLYDSKHSHLMNYSELANFCMEITDIYEEFQTIPCDVPDSSVVPIGEEDKNRFANVLPNKHSRVKLRMGRNERSDYINANYVTGYKGTERAYIATQSPLVNTVEDFWRMVWEQQSRVVLMLNPVLANRKPKQSPCYWPDNLKTDVRRLYGDFSVTLVKRDVQQDYIECTLELMDLEVNLKREIRHFWFTCWPESSILEPLKLVKFVLDTRPQYENSGAPVVIHCGPGQGRTGALIAVDVCMRRFEDKRRVDILDCVYKMRQERAGAVHNKEQYALIYQILDSSKFSVGNEKSLIITGPGACFTKHLMIIYCALNEYAVLLSSPSLSTRSSIITLHAML